MGDAEFRRRRQAPMLHMSVKRPGFAHTVNDEAEGRGGNSQMVQI